MSRTRNDLPLSAPSALARFRRDQRGTVAMMFGLSLVPLLGAAGVALDYSRAATARTHMLAAADATALSLTRTAETMSDPQLAAAGQAYFDAVYQDRYGVAPPPITVTRAGKTIAVSVTGVANTSLMRVLGKPTVAVAATAKANYERRKVEVALVLDNTGSMAASGKMPALKAATKDFLDALQAVAVNPGDVKVSIVPFDVQVRVPADVQALLVDPNPGAAWRWVGFSAPDATRASWTGCVNDRASPFNLRGDAGPSTATYPARRCGIDFGGGYFFDSPIERMMPLSTDFNALRARVASMTASGNTNIPIGLAWGLSTLTSTSVLPGAVAFGDATTDKYVVMLTDGVNTGDGQDPQGWSSGTKARIDANMQSICNQIKDPAKKIKVFTIRVIDGDANLIRDCASNPNMFFNAYNAAGIMPAFEAIKKTILGVRLTS